MAGARGLSSAAPLPACWAVVCSPAGALTTVDSPAALALFAIVWWSERFSLLDADAIFYLRAFGIIGIASGVFGALLVWLAGWSQGHRPGG
jgi:hypothetical protein